MAFVPAAPDGFRGRPMLGIADLTAKVREFRINDSYALSERSRTNYGWRNRRADCGNWGNRAAPGSSRANRKGPSCPDKELQLWASTEEKNGAQLNSYGSQKGTLHWPHRCMCSIL